tara:strand:- start:863 stop:3526 length:2664 start_codon:yes stop_codon:yes gene_type:complete
MTVKRSSEINKSRPASGAEIRSAFLKFYSEKSHKIIPSASLIPEDPTVLLTIAGMLPFKPVFLGKAKPPAPRATSSQKCIRTNDIENVGLTARHHTFFEMLGNFSFGDYFKTEAIEWAWELITDIYNLDPQNLIISVFREDDEAEEIWRNVVGVAPEKIIRMDEADNFWSSGSTGPCGPCSEIYYDFKPELGIVNIDLEDDTRFIEFYNLVFMQYNRDSNGTLIPLENCNIDTGMGLERMAQILQGVPNNYETDLIFPLIKKIALLVNLDYKKIDNKKKISLKIIADHSRAVTQLISDGVTASNLGKGYVLRRLLRRMVRHGRLIGIDKPFLTEIGDAAIDLMGDAYPQLLERRDFILAELRTEELHFLETLGRGERLLEQIISVKPKQILGSQAFELYDTYGFPIELTQEIAEDQGFLVDIKGFEIEMEKQRQRAKAASVNIDLTLMSVIEKATLNLSLTTFKGYDYLEFTGKIIAIFFDGELVKKASPGEEIKIVLDQTPFFAESGGQIGDKGVLLADQLIVEIDGVTKKNNVYVHHGVVKRGYLKLHDLVHAKVDHSCRRRVQSNHTATHLLQSALKLVIDESVAQRGSLVAFDRLRFDFNAPSPMTSSQLEEVETLINKWISEGHSIIVDTMSIDKALAAGALAMFGEKYGEIVRVVDVPGVSMELCGGTHVANTSELGLFKIVSEIGIASGIRRIEAIAGPSVLDYLNERDMVVKQLSENLKAQPSQILERVLTLQNEIKDLTRDLSASRKQLAYLKVLSLAGQASLINESKFIVKRLDGIDGSSLQDAAKTLMEQMGDDSAVILGGIPDADVANKIVFVAVFGSNLVKKGLNAGKFIGSIAKLCGGGGGGRPSIAQAGGRNAHKLDSALETAKKKISTDLL